MIPLLKGGCDPTQCVNYSLFHFYLRSESYGNSLLWQEIRRTMEEKRILCLVHPRSMPQSLLVAFIGKDFNRKYGTIAVSPDIVRAFVSVWHYEIFLNYIRLALTTNSVEKSLIS